ncbi:hypothetical protein Zm00014a_020444, partial [Zea mays]
SNTSKRELEFIPACVRCVNLQIIEVLAYAFISSKKNLSRFIMSKISYRRILSSSFSSPFRNRPTPPRRLAAPRRPHPVGPRSAPRAVPAALHHRPHSLPPPPPPVAPSTARPTSSSRALCRPPPSIAPSAISSALVAPYATRHRRRHPPVGRPRPSPPPSAVALLLALVDDLRALIGE